MRKTVYELVTQAEQELFEMGYKPTTIQHYKSTWNMVKRWCSDRSIEWFDRDSEKQLIEELGLNRNALSPNGHCKRRHIRALLSLGDSGRLPSFSRSFSNEVPDRFRKVLESYGSHLEQRGLARITQRGQLCIIRKFIVGLRIDDFGDVSMEDVSAHIEACSWMTMQTRAGHLYAIRAFTRWAADQGFCSPAVAAAMVVIPGHKHASLPSAYSVREVSAMVAATGEAGLRRDRAMLLLASVLGMRVGDIRALQLGNIDWRAHEIMFTQAKTGHPVRLPLPDEVRFALADYLRHERPTSTSDHVFLHHRAPHHSFEDSSNAFHYTATTAFGRALVNTSGKHHGMHSLRHSAATNMLSEGTAYPVISGVLGHMSTNTTRKYMAIDVEQLRSLSLEVPRG